MLPPYRAMQDALLLDHVISTAVHRARLLLTDDYALSQIWTFPVHGAAALQDILTERQSAAAGAGVSLDHLQPSLQGCYGVVFARNDRLKAGYDVDKLGDLRAHTCSKQRDTVF